MIDWSVSMASGRPPKNGLFAPPSKPLSPSCRPSRRVMPTSPPCGKPRSPAAVPPANDLRCTGWGIPMCYAPRPSSRSASKFRHSPHRRTAHSKPTAQMASQQAAHRMIRIPWETSRRGSFSWLGDKGKEAPWPTPRGRCCRSPYRGCLRALPLQPATC